MSSARARLVEEFGPFFTLESTVRRATLLTRLRRWIDYLVGR